MTAWQRTNVTERAERGLGTISFKRLLLAGGTAAVTVMFSGRLLGFAPSCAGGLLVLIAVLVMTHPLDGLPLLTYLARSLRALATVAAARQHSGLLAWLAQVLDIDPGAGVLHAAEVYDGEPTGEEEATPDEQGVLLESIFDLPPTFSESPFDLEPPARQPASTPGGR